MCREYYFWLTYHFNRDYWIKKVISGIINDIPTTLEPTGLAELKQIQLFTKWRKFVPDKFKDNICPKPPNELFQKIYSI